MFYWTSSATVTEFVRRKKIDLINDVRVSCTHSALCVCVLTGMHKGFWFSPDEPAARSVEFLPNPITRFTNAKAVTPICCKVFN